MQRVIELMLILLTAGTNVCNASSNASSNAKCDVDYKPTQIHIALGATPDCMTFNWATLDNPIVSKTFVKWSIGKHSNQLQNEMFTANNDSKLFVDSGSLKTTRTIHVITVCGLSASAKYYYQVGDPKYGWSDIAYFKTMPDQNTLQQMVANNIPQKFVIFGDLGHVNAQTLSMMTNESLSHKIDMILHVGDFAYDFDTNNGTMGDLFMNDIEKMASHVPYMVSPGNHEAAYNFSHYTERFRGMPVTGSQQTVPNGKVWTFAGEAPNNWYYSWNVGLVHFVSISTEIYFYFPWLIKEQYEWLIKDLTIANNNRSRAPWIIVNGHRPLYCTEDGDCTSDAQLVRDGVWISETNSTKYGLENVFYQFGVDFYFAGHEHNYERMYDIFQNHTTKSVKNMPSTTYIVTGSAGCQEKHDPFVEPQCWDAFRTKAYSYTRFYVYNSTHVELSQVVSDSTLPQKYQGYVIDHQWYVQEHHGAFGDQLRQIKSEDSQKESLKEFDVSAFDDKLSKQEIHEFDIPPVLFRHIPYLGDNKESYHNVDCVYF